MKKAGPPRVLILTMFSGESEYDECKLNCRSQRRVEIEHVKFKNLSNVAAHQRLYEEIMRRADEFDFFVKLDADTVLRDDFAISAMGSLLSEDPEIDQLVFPLYDFLSCSVIYGLHVFSPNVVWNLNVDRLFVDPDPEIPGKKVVLPESTKIYADHMPNPSLGQSYLFGVHRALKIAQPGRSKKNKMRARYQMNLLEKIARAQRHSNDNRRLTALLGAEDVFGNSIVSLTDKSAFTIPNDNEILGKIDKGRDAALVNWSRFSACRLRRRFTYL